MTEILTHGPYRVGDMVLVKKHQGPATRAIALGAWLRRLPKWARQYVHVALITSPDGQIVEMLTRGVSVGHVSKYLPEHRAIVSMGVDDHDAEQILVYARSVIATHEKYGWATIASLGVYCVTAAHLCLTSAGTAICSGFYSDALTRAGRIWPRPPFAMMPGDLAVAVVSALPEPSPPESPYESDTM